MLLSCIVFTSLTCGISGAAYIYETCFIQVSAIKFMKTGHQTKTTTFALESQFADWSVGPSIQDFDPLQRIYSDFCKIWYG